MAALAAALPGIATAAAVGLVGAAASALAKVSLDAVIQRDLPEESRASAFGRSETVLQLAWVSGGALGVLLPHDTFWIGFTVVAVRGRAGRRADRAAVPRPQHRSRSSPCKDRPVAPTVPAPRLTGPTAGAGAPPRPPVRRWSRCSPGAAAAHAPPEVTFAAGAASVVAKPTQYCDLKLAELSE